jgi:hypothetical protein
MNQEQLSGVYKVYSPYYALSGEEIVDKLYSYICGDSATCMNNRKASDKTVSYIQVIENRYCKIFNTTTEEDEVSAVERLQKLPKTVCNFSNNELRHTKYNRSFLRNKNGDFINSEFLTLQTAK